eukprot:gene10268-2417_t
MLPGKESTAPTTNTSEMVAHHIPHVLGLHENVSVTEEPSFNDLKLLAEKASQSHSASGQSSEKVISEKRSVSDTYSSISEDHVVRHIFSNQDIQQKHSNFSQQHSKKCAHISMSSSSCYQKKDRECHFSVYLQQRCNPELHTKQRKRERELNRLAAQRHRQMIRDQKKRRYKAMHQQETRSKHLQSEAQCLLEQLQELRSTILDLHMSGKLFLGIELARKSMKCGPTGLSSIYDSLIDPTSSTATNNFNHESVNMQQFVASTSLSSDDALLKYHGKEPYSTNVYPKVQCSSTVLDVDMWQSFLQFQRQQYQQVIYPHQPYFVYVHNQHLAGRNFPMS